MRHIFSIDENVTITALTYVTPAGERDLTAAKLLDTIFTNCHGFAMSTTTSARWSAKGQEYRMARRALNPALPSMMAQAMVTAGKCPQPEHGDPPALPEEADWSTEFADDRDFVRLAAHFRGCFLVTYDGRLRVDVGSRGLDHGYGFRVVTSDEAMPFAAEPST